MSFPPGGAISCRGTRIRGFSSRENIIIPDPEKAVRISDQNRHSKDVYAQPNGLQLMQKAYDEALDINISPVIRMPAKEANSL